ncbi:MAG: DUF2169 domain-containing protein [Deltaproteobacteria bacterium]|nr:DUF2169 domain-containing protein [Deltaproteobacteria bacterium]
MGHPYIENKTPFAFEPLFLTDEEGRPLFVPIVKATYHIQKETRLSLAEKQVPVTFDGEYWGDPEKSSYKYEPETAFIKPATDIVLIGHAYAPKPGVTKVDVSLRVGPMQKVVRVIGDRYWVKSFGITSMTMPRPFERIPLIYERAFGGWDRSHPNPDKHTFEPRNPVGTGFRGKKGKFEEGIRLPNLEDPQYPLKSFKNTPPPAGFGFTSPHWQPRAGFAGTYDNAWTKQRMPLLPTDFDRRFFNAAPQDQVAPGLLKGDVLIEVINASPSGKISFNLPGMPPPQCRVQVRGQKDHLLKTRLDTVIINTDENLLFLIWRTNMALMTGPQDVVSIEVSAEGLPKSVTTG